MKSLAKFSSLLILSLFLFSFTSTTESSWTRLGSKKVNLASEKDVIVVGRQDGKFTKLKFVVQGAPLNMRKATVHFTNGTSQNLPLKFNFSNNSKSRTIDLAGNKRVIKKITMWYDTKNRARQRATVSVFGRR